ncbi:Holliday junction DNA helicase subunit RuvA [Fructilactobacillus fructivorans]|uniref:Holliday junction branch migration protein RuvA n=1 Tax=Fructilactobacillus fructivorans TaxID=1614 RepID=UPI000704A18D|nr:Holliday junction branch migration protein RuvA [Fructilactobacillus fructivorans]KRN12602.1 Holliday junction DNA helicase subunit RuvA [Fructilactobacillus fructivorans]
MYEYLYGMITNVSPKCIVLDVNGVGYLIYVANPYHYDTDQQVRVYIHQSVSDNGVALYGFITLEDKQLFEQLLNVSGIGSKSALAIMAGNDSNGLVRAINVGNIKYLTKFPGIGKKTAQQIVLDLKDKITSNDVFTGNVSVDDVEDTGNKQLDDALSALQALGFKQREVDKIKAKLQEVEEDYTTDQYISAGLKLLTK